MKKKSNLKAALMLSLCVITYDQKNTKEVLIMHFQFTKNYLCFWLAPRLKLSVQVNT